MPSYAFSKIDSKQAEITQALRQAGCSVLSLARLGKNAPDLLVGFHGKNYLMEIKSEKKKLTVGQALFQKMWSGSPVVTVRSIADAFEVLGLP